jgi:hypothetical protein
MLANGAGWQIVTREAVAMIDTCHLRHLADGSASFLRTRGSVTGRRRSSPGSVVAEAASRPSVRGCSSAADRGLARMAG